MNDKPVDNKNNNYSKQRLPLLILIFVFIVISGILIFLKIYESYIKEILYAERLSQMENVTNQLFAGLEDVVANQWERVDSQCSRLQNNGIKTGNDLIEFMTEQERVDGLGEKSQNIIAVDSIGRYYYKSGLKGNLKEMDYLDNGYDRINFVTNTMTTNLTEMVFLKKLRVYEEKSVNKNFYDNSWLVNI